LTSTARAGGLAVTLLTCAGLLSAGLPADATAISEATGKPKWTAKVGADPYGVAVDVTRHLVFTANENSGTVSIVNGKTGTVIKTVRVGSSPDAIATDPALNRAYAVN
jgi:YVTN family beta-propeller protein